MAEIPQLDEEEMQSIYNWVDEIPLSRPKRNIARDFSDGGNLNSLSPLIKMLMISVGGGTSEALHSSLGGVAQLQRSSLPISKDL